MNLFIKNMVSIPKLGRFISCSQHNLIKQWRIDRGLPANRNAEGILTDGPDYTFLDGRPTPLLQKQKKRMLRNQEQATQIVELCSELEFAKQRYQNILRVKEQEREAVIKGRLKPKGNAMK